MCLAYFLEESYLPKLFVSSETQCFFCEEVKSILGHVSIGSVIPTITAWPMAFLLADKFKSYGTPSSTLLIKSASGRKEYFRHIKYIFRATNKNISGILITNYTVQFILCSFVLYMQQMQYKKIIEPLEFSFSEIKQLKDVKH